MQGPEDDAGLAGKVALISGGGAAGDGIGNGRAAAILLARAGAKVLVADRDLKLAERTVEMIAAEGTSRGGGIVGRPAFRGFSGILFATGLCFDRDFAGADMGRCLRRFRLRGDRENGDFGLPSARGVTAVSRAGPASEEGARAAGLGRLVDAPAEAGRLTLRACMRVTPASFRRLRRPRLLLGRGFGADGAWEDIFCSSTSICSQAFVCASA